MFNKIKNKIKEKLILFLGVDKLEKLLIEYQKHNDERFLSIGHKHKHHDRIINRHDEKIHALHDTLSSVVSIGSDIAYHSNGTSWAVVCIEGSYNVVKFIDLNGTDAREILNFLKHFEAGRYVHDAPPMMKHMAKEWFVDWQ